ncbi:MAG: DNA polymerase III subunit chi [Acetobacteraceae bacterium]|nr:DNA polymerase III subunit chi [Acetobacteraceae bacterium]
MAEIGFYHLTRSTLEQALPRLLGRVLALPGRAVILCGSRERLEALDAFLWTCPEPDWLPHGHVQNADAPHHPIWLATEDAAPPNGARHLFLTDGAVSARLSEYDRVFDLFDGRDEAAVQAARGRWKAAKAAGHGLAYWQQTASGWDRKG